MFFEMNDEKMIGYKQLTQADLGKSPTSNQTHIGLSESVLTFLSDRDIISENSIFIYEDKFEYIDAYFDRIENQDGTFRSPKIRTGDRGCVSIVTTIRGIVKNFAQDIKWYLVWFGLKNSKIVFFLFNDISVDYAKFFECGLNLDCTGTKSINGQDAKFLQIINYIEQKVNSNGEEILKELEIITQTENILPNKKFRAYDIEKANENNKKIGRYGEELVNEFFKREVELGRLISFKWYNENGERGLPYDFSIQDCKNNITYLDVKTTGYDFEQKMIFSSQEIDFISTTPYSYSIYRVYKDNDQKYLLRICDECKELSISINNNTKIFSSKLEQLHVVFRGAKFAIPPNAVSLKFKPEITM